MEYTTLGSSELKVSRICMGGCPMGGYAWGKVEERELVSAVHAAVDAGVTFFDTADVYGTGSSEMTLGKSLAGLRDKVVIASKFGVRVENGRTFYDNSLQWIQQALEGSLKRLGTDCIDLYQIHYRDGKTPLEEVVAGLERMKEQGKIRHFGLSNVYAADVEEISPLTSHFVSFQDEYSLACRKHEADMQQFSEQLNLTPLTWGSLGQGVLTGKYNRDSCFGKDDRRSRETYVNFHGEKFHKNLNIVDAMRPIADAHGKSLAATAIRFILDFLPSSVVLCGAKTPQQILGNVQGSDWQLSADELRQLDIVSR